MFMKLSQFETNAPKNMKHISLVLLSIRAHHSDALVSMTTQSNFAFPVKNAIIYDSETRVHLKTN